jgi:hypothetical protein
MQEFSRVKASVRLQQTQFLAAAHAENIFNFTCSINENRLKIYPPILSLEPPIPQFSSGQFFVIIRYGVLYRLCNRFAYPGKKNIVIIMEYG